MRKNGIKTALPTNSILFIKDEECGINLLIASPEVNAPIIASSPASSAKKDPKKTDASTNVYCEIESSYLLKNHRESIGKSNKTMQPNIAVEIVSLIQKAAPMFPFVMPVTVASTSRARRSAIIVPPIVRVTD
jgi:hypothetical protein